MQSTEIYAHVARGPAHAASEKVAAKPWESRLGVFEVGLRFAPAYESDPARQIDHRKAFNWTRATRSCRVDKRPPGSY